MKYVSIDIETTGLNPEKHNIIQLAMVIDDTTRPDISVDELPKFDCYVYRDEWVGDPIALAMNAEIIARIAAYRKCRATTDKWDGDLFYYEGHLGIYVKSFLEEHGIDTVIPAGKNFASFDRRFLERLPNWTIKFTHRTIDPTSMYMTRWDEKPPNLDSCLKRAGINTLASHNAYDDACDVIRCVRHALANNGWIA